MRKSFRKLLCSIGLLCILWSGGRPAEAIPAFARKYRTSCSTCHSVFPTLNSFGKAFKASGYRIPESDEDMIKDSPVSLGDPAWKVMFPNAVWPSDIPGGPVVAFWLSSQFLVNPSAPITNEFDGLNELYILSGGTLGESFSFFMELEIIDGGTVPTEFGKALPRAFVQYNHPSHKFNVSYGLFEPRAVLASSRLRFIRIGDYLSNRYGVPPAGNSFSLSPNQRGLELWGHLEGPGGKGGLEWFGGVVNGRDDGTPQGADAYGPQVQQRNERLQLLLDQSGRSDFENNSSKDFYVGANYKIAGMGVLGGGISDIALGPNQIFNDQFLALGFFFYRGKAPALVSEAGHEVLARSGNTFHRLGAKLETSIGKTNLLGGVQWNRDRIRGGQGLFTEVISLVEARHALYPWLIAAVRYENLNPDFGIAFNRTTLHGSILARANVRLALEGVLSRNSKTDPLRDFRRYDSGNDSRFQVRLDFAY